MITAWGVVADGIGMAVGGAVGAFVNVLASIPADRIARRALAAITLIGKDTLRRRLTGVGLCITGRT